MVENIKECNMISCRMQPLKMGPKVQTKNFQNDFSYLTFITSQKQFSISENGIKCQKNIDLDQVIYSGKTFPEPNDFILSYIMYVHTLVFQ